jgi:protein tyrosine phosphatase (PTP) superfamily phosphohydrolase (DUF442 family)
VTLGFRSTLVRRLFQGAAVVAGVLVLCASFIVARQDLSYRDEKQSFPGISNFGRVNDRLWRGAQPDTIGFETLRARGVDIVVSFTLAGPAQQDERQEVEGLGMRWVGIPWSAESLPAPDQVATFLRVVRENPARRIFLHCKHGADRTGVMVALYRLTFDHWTTDAALSEMEAFHHYWLLLPHLDQFVRTYGDALGSRALPPL